MSISASFSILLSVETMLGVTGLRWFALEFIYCEGYDMWTGAGCIVTYGVASLLLVLVLIWAQFITRPFDRIIGRIKKTGERASEEEISRCLTCYKKLNTVVVVCNLIGFFIGQILVTGTGVLQGRTPRVFSLLFMVIMQAIGFGMVSCITTVNVMDAIFAPLRKILKVRSLKEHTNARYMNVSRSVSLTAFCVVYFITMNMFTVYYGVFFHAEYDGIPTQDMVNVLFDKGIECFLMSIAYSFLPIFILVRGIDKRIRATAESIEDIAERSDLTQRIDITMLDDFGMLTTDLNTLIARLSSMIRELKSGAVAISDSAGTLSDSATSAESALDSINESLGRMNASSDSQNYIINKTDESLTELAESVENVKQSVVNQTAAMEQISGAMTEMTESISSVTGIAYQAQQVSVELSETSQSGESSIRQAIASMSQIQAASDEVQSIIRVIQKISSQTNLLAMNAAIEAAHAGEVGQGFAVVADEVRSLASSSAKSAKEIQMHIKDMSDRINLGVQAISEAGGAFKSITERVAENGELVKQIYEAMEEQKAGALETKKATADAVTAINCVKVLAESEAENAESVRKYMNEVVTAARETDKAIEQSSECSERLREAITLVADAADRNETSVDRMNTHIDKFSV